MKVDLKFPRVIFAAALFALYGLTACERPPSEPVANSANNQSAKSSSLKIVDAKYYTSSTGTIEREGSTKAENVARLLQADSSLLDRLSQIVVHGARVSYILFGANDETWWNVCGCRPNSWIDCKLSDGQDVRVVMHGLVRPWYVVGEARFCLDISEEESDEILSDSGWREIAPKEQGSGNVLKKESFCAKNLSQSGVELITSASFDVTKPEQVAVVSAECYLFSSGQNTVSDPTGKLLGYANQETLNRLSEEILEGRLSTLRHFPNGQVKKLNPGEEPEAVIKCRMNDGQDIVLQRFASDNRICVVGEGEFRLNVRSSRMRQLLEPEGWNSPK